VLQDVLGTIVSAASAVPASVTDGRVTKADVWTVTRALVVI